MLSDRETMKKRFIKHYCEGLFASKTVEEAERELDEHPELLEEFAEWEANK